MGNIRLMCLDKYTWDFPLDLLSLVCSWRRYFTFREGNVLVTFHITMTKCRLVGMAEQTKVLLASLKS